MATHPRHFCHICEGCRSLGRKGLCFQLLGILGEGYLSFSTTPMMICISEEDAGIGGFLPEICLARVVNFLRYFLS